MSIWPRATPVDVNDHISDPSVDAPSDVATRSRRLLPTAVRDQTANLPFHSRALYFIRHISSQPSTALFAMAVVVLVYAGVALADFPNRASTIFGDTGMAVTLFLLFAIQHTTNREQTAIQRKLDELLRALPGADDNLMLLEEAPQKVLLEVETANRDALRENSDDENVV